MADELRNSAISGMEIKISAMQGLIADQELYLSNLQLRLERYKMDLRLLRREK